MPLATVNWRPTARQLRLFGLSAIVALGLLGALLWFHHALPTAAVVCWAVGGVAGLLGLTGTAAGLPGYWVFTAVGFVLGNIIGRLLMAVVFYGVVTPMGLLARLFGRDRLRLKRPVGDSTWQDVPDITGADPYERQS